MAALRAEARAQRRITRQAGQRIGKGYRIPRGYRQAGLTVPIHPVDAVIQLATHNRFAARHRLDLHNAECLCRLDRGD